MKTEQPRRPPVPPTQRHRDRKNDYQRKSWPFPAIEDLREVRNIPRRRSDPNDFETSPI